MSHHKHPSEPEPDKNAAQKPAPAEPAKTPAETGSTVTVSKEQYEALKAERDDLMGRLQRVSADYINYQKRAARDLEQAREFANEEIIKSLLHVLDDMERAMEHARASHDVKDPLMVGMELVHKNALATLTRFGLTPIEATGKPFDPECHAALMQEPSAEHQARTVLRELQRGYQLKGRTIRPSQVVVSKEPETPTKEKPEENKGE
jgi:molecular chaperone GrpE